MSVAASVVVPTFERPALVVRCLHALCAQEFARAYEIIVVDDGSSPEAAAVLQAAIVRCAQRLRQRPAISLSLRRQRRNRGPAAARNLGWRAARAPFVAFTDDDTVPTPGWLREGVAALEAGADAVAGGVVVPLPAHPTDYERDAAGLAHAGFVTASCFVRKAALQAVGGFDERFRIAWREDTDLMFALRAHGASIVAAPAAAVLHPVRPARFGISLAQQRKTMFDALLYKKYPRWYRRDVRPHPPYAYYAAVASGLCGLAGAATGHPALALGGVLAWVALALRFARRRLAATSHAPRHVAEMLWTSLWIPWLSLYWRLLGSLRFRVLFV